MYIGRFRTQACDTVPGESPLCHPAESHSVSKQLRAPILERRSTLTITGVRIEGPQGLIVFIDVYLAGVAGPSEAVTAE